MNMEKSLFSFFVPILFCLLLIQPGCKKNKPVSRSGSEEKSSSQSLIDSKNIKKNVRKNGEISIRVSDVDDVKKKIKGLVDQYNAQILEEHLSINNDRRRTMTYKIKMKSDDFTLFMDKLSSMGTLLRIHIEAEDVTNELTQSSDRIDLLKSRLNDAKKSKNAKLIDTLQKKLDDARRSRQHIKTTVLYSYIYLEIDETTKLSHAFSLGFYYGREGFVFMVKAVVVIIIASVPLIILFLLIKLFLTLIKWRWGQLIAAIENIGMGKSAKDKPEKKPRAKK